MLRLALLTARTRPGSFAGALLAFAMSAVLVMAGGMLLQAALRTHPPVERYAAAAAVIVIAAGKRDCAVARSIERIDRQRQRDRNRSLSRGYPIQLVAKAIDCANPNRGGLRPRSRETCELSIARPA